MPDEPLAGLTGTAGDSPVARVAGALLESLGADLMPVAGARIQLGDATADLLADTATQAWARTGFGAAPAGALATLAQALAAMINVLAPRPLAIDAATALGERSALLGLPPAGIASASGAARLVATADGWVAVQLPRDADMELIRALVEDTVENDGDPWQRVTTWAATRSIAEIIARTTLLGLAAAAVGSQPVPDAPWRVRRLSGPLAPSRRSGLAVNLGSLWAAPLCAQSLHRCGYHVIDVESPERPDGSRLGAPVFHGRLHAGHELAIIETQTPAGRGELAALLSDADVVITGSRPAALRRLGAAPPKRPVRNQVWVAITGYGPASERVAFGDDAAVAGRLVAFTPAGEPRFAGDALADPLTGLAAAAAALACARAGGSWQVDAALADVAAYAAHLR